MPDFRALGVTFVEIPLNKFVYRFRRLSWREELRMKLGPKDDQRRIVLATAVRDVSGLVLSRSDAKKAVQAIPEAVMWRFWVLYWADLPVDRYYTSGALRQSNGQVALASTRTSSQHVSGRSWTVPSRRD